MKETIDLAVNYIFKHRHDLTVSRTELKCVFEFATTLRGLIFGMIIFREFSEFFRKFMKFNPGENFRKLWICEIREI